jgi:hypothetical protein
MQEYLGRLTSGEVPGFRDGRVAGPGNEWWSRTPRASRALLDWTSGAAVSPHGSSRLRDENALARMISGLTHHQRR